MSFNLVDVAKGYLTNQLIGKASSFLGESESGVTKAVSGLLPSVISGLINKSGSSDGANVIAQLAGEQHRSGILDNLSGLFSGDRSSGVAANATTSLIGSLFGNKADGIAGLISNFAGIGKSSSSSLLGMIAPFILGLIGKHAASNNLNAGSIASLLSSQKDAVSSAMPSGLNLSSIFGSSDATSHVKAAASHAASTYQEEEKKSGMGWLLPLLLLALLAAGAYYWFKGCNKPVEDHAATTTVVEEPKKDTVVATVTPPATTARESFKVKLANGVEIDAYKGGIEDKLVTFLNSDYKALGADSLKKIWFDFDDLNFNTGSAVITAESKRQVDNMIAILKAYPAVKVKIGGYTDKVGNEANNVKLSGARANAVKDALTKAEVGKQVDGAEGYGSQFAKYAADAPESDRVKDRHVSVSVRM